jgi:7-cyano-7-deazaguanine synthase
MMKPSGSLILLSGGLDSTTALAFLAKDGGKAETLFVDYGHPARREERSAAAKIAIEYGVRHQEVQIDGLEVPSGEIRGRNAMLLITALMTAPASGNLVVGIHRDTPYWDCSPGFVASMQAVIDGYARGSVQVLAPFQQMGKADIRRLAEELAVPVDAIYSCERPDGPCGECVSCEDDVR